MNLEVECSFRSFFTYYNRNTHVCLGTTHDDIEARRFVQEFKARRVSHKLTQSDIGERLNRWLLALNHFKINTVVSVLMFFTGCLNMLHASCFFNQSFIFVNLIGTSRILDVLGPGMGRAISRAWRACSLVQLLYYVWSPCSTSCLTRPSMARVWKSTVRSF